MRLSPFDWRQAPRPPPRELRKRLKKKRSVIAARDIDIVNLFVVARVVATLEFRLFRLREK
ncbi:MAG: hypothetical protein ABIH03_11630 [Pseudomonadota bacterium]